MESDIHLIRSITNHQLDQLLDLYKNEWWTSSRTNEEVEIMLKGSSKLFVYVDAENNVLGFARTLSDGIYKTFIFDVIVKDEFRTSGLGRRIITDILQDEVISKTKHIELYCAPNMIGFYKKFGFTTELGEITLMRLSK